MAKHIILISIDNLRFDCIGYQPDKKELENYDVLKYLETPVLDTIAERSLCFTQCISTNTYTTAAHASALTGLYPPRHGVRAFYETKLSRGVYTLAEILKVYGYETVMMTDTVNLFKPLDLNRGFDHLFHNDDSGLLKFLGTKRETKLFFFAHLFDVHEPFLLSENDAYDNSDYRREVALLYEKFDIKGRQRPQDNDKTTWRRLLDLIGRKDHNRFFPLFVRGVSKFDRGRFRDFMSGLDRAGLLEDSLLVIFSDHGEGKSSGSDPQGFAHGGMLFDSVIRVPLMIQGRDISPGVVDRTVSLVDIVPTVLEHAVPCRPDDVLPYSLDGMSLVTPSDDNRMVYSETWQRDNRKLLIPMMFISSFLWQRAVRTSTMKCLLNGSPELFSKANDLNQMSDEDFVKNIYRGLFSKFEEYDDYSYVLTELKEKRITKEKFLKGICRTTEYKSKPPYLVYDIVNDRLEERPAKLFKAPESQSSPGRCFDTLQRLSEKGENSDEIFPGDEESIRQIIGNVGKDDWGGRAEVLIKNKHLLSCLMDEFIVHRLDKNFAYNRKDFQNMVLTSREFSLFLYEQALRRSGKTSIVKYLFRRYIPYHVQQNLFEFFNYRAFPRKTRRGRAWRRLQAWILGS